MKHVKKSLQTARCRKYAAALALCCAAAYAQAQSPYIHRVYEYLPAPGQFVNALPGYEDGNTQEDMNRKAEEQIAAEHHNKGMITLGGYGGYVVFGFDHPVGNVAGRYDFRILGNAFYANANPNSGASREGGSCEPGIVMVSRDANANGLPDDPWYELAGSEYHRPQTTHGYRITYYRPDENKTPDPDPGNRYINDRTYIRWTTNGRGDGYLFRNIFHSQPYYPRWINSETLSFEGTCLANNYVDESGKGTYYVQYAYHWGYADNHPNTDNRSAFDIGWAVDAAGNSVWLDEIHFVKVYTGVNQYCGWLGETSTEISGAIDLHLAGGDASVPVFAAGVNLSHADVELQPGETFTLTAAVVPANATNKAITWKSLDPSIVTISQTGKLTALVEGATTIQAIANDGYYIAECRVRVQTTIATPEPEETPKISLSHSRLYMHPGDRIDLTADVTPPAEGQQIAWESSNATVAEVTVNGLVLAVAPGTAIITASLGSSAASCTISVEAATSTAAVAASRPQALYVGGTLRLVHLEGYDCALFTIQGHKIGAFRPVSGNESYTLRLPAGIYLLTAQKQGTHITLKIMTRD
jgi:hypothetical protein